MIISNYQYIFVFDSFNNGVSRCSYKPDYDKPIFNCRESVHTQRESSYCIFHDKGYLRGNNNYEKNRK